MSATSGWTALYITPGHQFRVVDALITNFHLPRSTLLVLVAAFAGRSLLFDAYQEALRLRYRFFSFGDAHADRLAGRQLLPLPRGESGVRADSQPPGAA